jgi:hypothetical protein
MTKIMITSENGEVTEFETTDFLLLFDDGGEQVGVVGELTPEFIQECLIINPIEQFAKQYEEGELE